MLRCILPFFFFIVVAQVFSQSMPETDVLWLDIEYHNGELTVGDTHHVAVRPGYDNQPYFLHSNEGLLFSSNNGNGLTDIYLHYFSNKGTYNLTNSPAMAEYSAKQVPGQKRFTTVTVEEDGTTQRIWQYDFPGTNRQVLFPDNKAVGYYHWLDGQQLAAFILEDSFTLHHLQPSLTIDTLVDGPIGRCLLVHPTTEALTYVWKPSTDTTWWIKSWQPATGEQKILMPTLPQVEDYVWLPDGGIIMADKGVIYQYKDKEWQPVADLSQVVPHFYRMVIGPRAQRLAIVSFEGEKP